MKKLENFEQKLEQSDFIEENYISKPIIKFRNNHKNYPCVILPDHRILVYTDCKIYKDIYSYLISFSDPIYRPKHIHEYKITKFSLYTAMVLHYSAEEIIEILKIICKNETFPKSLEK